MRVEILPLLLRRQVRLTRFFFNSPDIHLRRNPDDTWNTATPSTSPQPSTTPHHQTRLPDLAADLVEIRNARITLDLQSTTHPTSIRTFDHIDLTLRDLSLTHTFPFTLDARLPSAGTLHATGAITPSDPSVTAHIDATHLDLAALDPTPTPISGLLDHLTLDATWQPHHLHLSNLALRSPHLTLTPTPHTTSAAPRTPTETTLTLDTADLRLDALTLPPRPNRPAITLRDLHAQIPHITPAQPTPFTLSARLPGAGALEATGTVLPQSPLNLSAHLTVHHLDLASSTLLPPASPIAGALALDAHLTSANAALSVAGTAHLDHLQLARSGQPSAIPVTAAFSLTETAAHVLEIHTSTIHLGTAPITLAGTIDHTHPTPILDLHIQATALPIDQIESFLPSVGVQLPENSRLRGGILTSTLTLSGPPASLSTHGPIHLEDTELAGFDLGARLQSLARYTGGRLGSATASGTHLRSLTLTLDHTPNLTRTSALTADIAGIGTLTGDGTIGPALPQSGPGSGPASGSPLHFNLTLKLTDLVAKPTATNPNGSDTPSDLARSIAAMLPPAWAAKATTAINSLARGPLRAGVPILVGGTTRHPSITPNLGAILPREQPAKPADRRVPPRPWPSR